MGIPGGPSYPSMRSDRRPRFVRRHMSSTLDALSTNPSKPPTRRVRKAAARIKREAMRLGLW